MKSRINLIDAQIKAILERPLIDSHCWLGSVKSAGDDDKVEDGDCRVKVGAKSVSGFGNLRKIVKKLAREPARDIGHRCCCHLIEAQKFFLLIFCSSARSLELDPFGSVSSNG